MIHSIQNTANLSSFSTKGTMRFFGTITITTTPWGC